MAVAEGTSLSEGLSAEYFCWPKKKGWEKPGFCEGWVANCDFSQFFGILFELWMNLCHFWGWDSSYQEWPNLWEDSKTSEKSLIS